jgi:hypothetical protein
LLRHILLRILWQDVLLCFPKSNLHPKDVFLLFYPRYLVFVKNKIARFMKLSHGRAWQQGANPTGRPRPIAMAHKSFPVSHLLWKTKTGCTNRTRTLNAKKDMKVEKSPPSTRACKAFSTANRQ